MSKLIRLVIFASFLVLNLHAYEVTSGADIKWIGYKYQSKVYAEGTFSKFVFSHEKKSNFLDFLKTFKIDIDALSLETGLKLRTDNILVLFNGINNKNIHAKVLSVNGDEKKGKMQVAITMNDVTKNVEFEYLVVVSTIEAYATIDILDFKFDKSWDEFKKVSKPFHDGKTWSEVGLAFAVDYKR